MPGKPEHLLGHFISTVKIRIAHSWEQILFPLKPLTTGGQDEQPGLGKSYNSSMPLFLITDLL